MPPAHPLAYQSAETTIGDCTYTVIPLGFPEGRKAFVRLMKLFGPFLGALATFDVKGGIGRAMVDQAIGGAIGNLLAHVSDDDLVYFQNLYAPKTTVTMPNGKKPQLKDIIDTHFAGPRFGEYFEWLVFCIRSTYGDFFAGVWTKVGNTFPQAPTNVPGSSSNSPMDSNGPSGESSNITE